MGATYAIMVMHIFLQILLLVLKIISWLNSNEFYTYNTKLPLTRIKTNLRYTK